MLGIKAKTRSRLYQEMKDVELVKGVEKYAPERQFYSLVMLN